MSTDALSLRAEQANRRAAEAYRRLENRYTDFHEIGRTRRVSRRRFTTLLDRIRRTGAPYGAHTLVYRSTGEVLLVRHEGVGLWVLPGGGIDEGETYIEAARRELEEEAGVEATYDGLAVVTRETIRTGHYEMWGIVPVFAAQAHSTETDVTDPDGEISRARWFDRPPQDTRDRALLCTWQDRILD